MNKIQTRVSLSISYIIYIIHIILILLILHTINNVYISCTLEKRNKNKYAIDTITRDTQNTLKIESALVPKCQKTTQDMNTSAKTTLE